MNCGLALLPVPQDDGELIGPRLVHWVCERGGEGYEKAYEARASATAKG